MAVLADTSPRVALNAFQRIADRWGLDAAQRSALLGRSGRTGYRYGSGAPAGRLAADVRERLSLLVGIYEDLRMVFGAGPQADEWVRRPNRHFGDRPPLERLLSGKIADLVLVRRYLAAAKQGITASL